MRFGGMSQFSMHLFVAICFIGASCSFVRAQQPATPDTAFEAASIRPEHFTPGCHGESAPGGIHYVLNCVSLRELIALAWKIHPDNIRGADSQALETNYELSAVTPGGQP